MSKVLLVGREEIEAVRNTLANGGGAVGVLRWAESVLAAQPAEAEGAVEMGSDAWMALHLLDRLSVDSSDELRVLQIEGIVKSMGAALSAVTAERDRLLSENARLIEDRARFPDRPDDIGHMIGSHIGNLKAGKVQAEKYARKWRDNLDSEIRAVDQLRAEVEALRNDAERYAHLKAAWDDDVLISYLDSNVHPSDWDKVIDAAMAAKEA